MSAERDAVESVYTPELLEPSNDTPWDRGIEDVRQGLIRDWARGAMLDLCCGTGAHLSCRVTSGLTVGADFVPSLLAHVRHRSLDPAPPLVAADAHAGPFASASFDTIVSYSSLYTMRDLGQVVDEVRRVLRPDGVAILDLGNRRSLMHRVAQAHHEESGWLAHTTTPLAATLELVRGLGEIVVWRSFQLLPMLRPVRRQRWLVPVAHPGWKLVLGRRVRGRMLDEWMSSLPGLRRAAFRHLVVVRRSV